MSSYLLIGFFYNNESHILTEKEYNNRASNIEQLSKQVFTGPPYSKTLYICILNSVLCVGVFIHKKKWVYYLVPNH